MLSYTFGEIVDRLCITNLKMWHLEEQMNDPKISLEEKGKISEHIVELNTLRNKCIDSINEYFQEIVGKK
jgi:hypothetical protein